MPADVHERIDLAIAGADDDDGLACHLEEKIVASRRYLALVPDIEPRPHEDRADFPLEDLGVVIDLARQSVAAAILIKQAFERSSHLMHLDPVLVRVSLGWR